MQMWVSKHIYYYAMRNCRAIALFIIGLLMAANLVAQDERYEEPEKFSDRFFWGGTLGLMVGHITQIDVVPIGGMWIFPQWSVGVAGRYGFYNQRGVLLTDSKRSYSSHIWGGSVFTQVLPIPDFSEVFSIPFRGGIILHSEYEKIFIDRRVSNPFGDYVGGKTWTNLVLVGFGYWQRVGDKAGVNMLLLWEVSKNEFSPYQQNPIIRVTFTL